MTVFIHGMKFDFKFALFFKLFLTKNLLTPKFVWI